jgi:hypothetical protein
LQKTTFYTIFIVSLLISKLNAEECRSDLKSLLSEVGHTNQICLVFKNFYKYRNRETWNALTIDKSDELNESEPEALRFTVWVLDKRGTIITKALDYPVYQESIPGDKLLEFKHVDITTRLAFGDFNNDSQTNFAFFISEPPRAHFIIKGVNNDKLMVENLGYRENDQGQWSQHEYITTGTNAEITLQEKKIEIKVFEETEVFRLMGTQYEKAP